MTIALEHRGDGADKPGLLTGEPHRGGADRLWVDSGKAINASQELSSYLKHAASMGREYPDCVLMEPAFVLRGHTPDSLSG